MWWAVVRWQAVALNLEARREAGDGGDEQL